MALAHKRDVVQSSGRFDIIGEDWRETSNDSLTKGRIWWHAKAAVQNKAMTVEAIFSVFFILAILAIPFFTGRGLWRAIDAKRQVEREIPKVQRAKARVIGLTERKYDSENHYDYFVVVEYETTSGKMIWAETQPFDEGDYNVNETVNVMYRPKAPHDVMIMPNEKMANNYFAIEKYFGFVPVIASTVFVFGIALRYHGFAPDILGPLALAYAAGYIWAHLRKDSDTRGELSAAQLDLERRDRMQQAQSIGIIPCRLHE